MDEILLKNLEKLGLTEAESSVYVRLLEHGTSTGGELAKISAYSRPKVYEILEKLVNSGLAESFPTRPKKFRALDPEIAIPSYFGMKKAQLDEMEGKLKNSLGEYFKMPESKESEIFVNHGLRRCSLKYCELVKNAKDEVFSFLGWTSKEEIENIIVAYNTARKNNVRTKLAYFENEIFKDQASKEAEEELSSVVDSFYPVPADMFLIRNPPVKFLLVDDHTVHITMGDYLEDGTLKDVISAHYYNMPTFSKMARKIADSYFDLLFGGGP